MKVIMVEIRGTGTGTGIISHCLVHRRNIQACKVPASKYT
jgi:hypothetical protein